MDEAVHLSGESSVHTRTPVRTCLGCRRRDGQAALLRVVADAEASSSPGTDWLVLPDPPRRRPGRGAYVHLDRECVTQAIRRGAFGRALRVQGRADTAALESLIAQQL